MAGSSADPAAVAADSSDSFDEVVTAVQAALVEHLQLDVLSDMGPISLANILESDVPAAEALLGNYIVYDQGDYRANDEALRSGETLDSILERSIHPLRGRAGDDATLPTGGIQGSP